jgi:hypothetical protein
MIQQRQVVDVEGVDERKVCLAFRFQSAGLGLMPQQQDGAEGAGGCSNCDSLSAH